MRDEVRRALDIGPSASIAERTIDITTTGRRSGRARRIEICFYRESGETYISGIPGPRKRDWLINIEAEPKFVFHLKGSVKADLPAMATVITASEERRRILGDFVDEFNQRNGDDNLWPSANLEEWVAGSPLVRVDFLEVD